MNNRRTLLLLLVFVLSLSFESHAQVVDPSPTASASHIFPQFADGFFTDGSYYRSTLMISNRSDTASVTCTLQLNGLSLPDFSLTYSLGPGGWTISPTSGTAAFQSGYATLQCSGLVDAQLLYSYYSSDGVKISEATVFSSARAPVMNVISDQREGAALGLAIANDSNQPVVYTISVRGDSTLLGSASVTVAARRSIARFLNQFVSGIPSDSITLVSVAAAGGASTSIIGLRFTGTVFTTIPGTVDGGVGGLTGTHHVFPQFADGKFADGTFYRTTRIITNPSAAVTADCTTQLRGMTVGGVSVFTASVTAGHSLVFGPTPGVQAFQSGYATTDCNSIVYAQLLYSYFAPNGRKLSEATVFTSPPADRVQILADTREGARVGLAIANDSDFAGTYTITISDPAGTVVATATQSLLGRKSVARFIDELALLPPDFYGRVLVTSSSGAKASVIGLRFTGSIFTTIPETIR